MANLQALRRKIGSVKNTQKITKAMKMVAASKLRRAQQRILAFRPYGQELRRVLANLSGRVNQAVHPLFQKRPVKIIQVTVVTSDRGLCGAFNMNVIRKATQLIQECEGTGAKVIVGVVGRKGNDYFRRRHWPIRNPNVNVFERLTYEHALEVGWGAVEAFTEGVFDEGYIVYNEFKNVVQQQVVVEKVFPIEPLEEFGAAETPSGGGYLYEPDQEDLLESLLPKYAQGQVYRILLESSAAEQSARMAAMDGATRNAGELIKHLSLKYNRSRQEAITKELMDIVGGAEALK
ncbi:MAG: ATP synthase F1 subunit gamma [Nitrospirales bacterium]|nr:ATP synthase F1 subunit gamma [Nitrospira sp.]MDR4461884.1 ATP synthase F1 subunit gamma [Nitrospirales bacterium]MDR4483908.1 ATP synthase F1 subunit gamma [Nitrospirales bacterium]